MNNDTSGWIAMVMCGLTLLNLILLLFSAYRKLPAAEQYLTGCRIISDTKRLWKGNGPIAMLNRLGAVALVFTLSVLLEKRGLIDRNETDQVPLSLRIWTAGPIVGSCMLLLGAVSLWLMAKIGNA
ncbi:hypothetical protein [Pseudomonas sp. Bc-h]|jgi:hypothetical protein|uniref:hypothetical protein n=1 Tax=Pseudomonas sp. Bc-h TaxID=1943632 RepID=UPI0009DAC1AD|nr:hypothetical protein [Pseudomonas sp. Bc-h]